MSDVARGYTPKNSAEFTAWLRRLTRNGKAMETAHQLGNVAARVPIAIDYIEFCINRNRANTELVNILLDIRHILASDPIRD
jgi:hypothetical protein